MNIQRIICNPLEENCYVVSDASGECVMNALPLKTISAGNI